MTGGAKIIVAGGPGRRLFRQAIMDQLRDRKFYLVEHMAADLVELLATPGMEFGVVHAGVIPGYREVIISLLGWSEEGTLIQGEPIKEGAQVMAEIGGTVICSTSKERVLGAKISQGTGRAGDQIRVRIVARRSGAPEEPIRVATRRSGTPQNMSDKSL